MRTYQNTIIDGVETKGFTNSHISWKSIQQLGVSFFNKSVCDIGCYHGYFSFQAERCGASLVVGYEPERKGRDRAIEIGELNGSAVRFVNKRFGGPNFFKRNTSRQAGHFFSRGSGFDIAIAMNMLHWVRKEVGMDAYVKAITEMCESCMSLVLEVDPVDYGIIKPIAQKAGMSEARAIPSHRHNRIIVYFAPWGGTKTINIREVKNYRGDEISVDTNHSWDNTFAFLHNTAKRWGYVGAGVEDDMATIERHFNMVEARNQPIYDISLKYYMTPIRDVLRLISCYNGIRAGVTLPPIGIKKDNCLHQGHTRIKAYKLNGLCDIDLQYYEKEIYRDLCYRKTGAPNTGLGRNFML